MSFGSVLLGYNTVLLGIWIVTFQGNSPFSPSRVRLLESDYPVIQQCVL
jgi:hypothetical protein